LLIREQDEVLFFKIGGIIREMRKILYYINVKLERKERGR